MRWMAFVARMNLLFKMAALGIELGSRLNPGPEVRSSGRLPLSYTATGPNGYAVLKVCHWCEMIDLINMHTPHCQIIHPNACNYSYDKIQTIDVPITAEHRICSVNSTTVYLEDNFSRKASMTEENLTKVTEFHVLHLSSCHPKAITWYSFNQYLVLN